MPINCSEDASKAIRPAFPKSTFNSQECFFVLCLNTRNEPIGKPAMVAMGTCNEVQVHPRDVFRMAVRKNAVHIIVAHNHPSQDVSPSDLDIELTKKLSEAGNLLGIPLLDHIILNKDRHLSIMEETA